MKTDRLLAITYSLRNKYKRMVGIRVEERSTSAVVRSFSSAPWGRAQGRLVNYCSIFDFYGVVR